MGTYRNGWKDGVRYVAAMIRVGSWDPAERRRLYELARFCIDAAPETAPPPTSEWRASAALALDEAPAPAEPGETHK